VHLHLSARERSPGLEEWILVWWNTGRNLEVLEPRDWFTTAHNQGDFGWFPAPAATDTAIGQFCEALHKRPHCYHVLAIPFLMTNRWRKTLLKAVDVYFVLKPVCEIWDNSQHEPPGTFISHPLSRHEPWCLRHTHPVVDLARSLREVPDADFLQKMYIVCESLYWMRQLETMQEGMMWRLLHPIGGGAPFSKIAQGRRG
jgi:hypothetical protein